jgi:AraC family transcriptional activator of pobA
MPASPVPSFYLYGEPHQSAAEGFVHVETIAARSLPSDWTIRPHAHHELVQLFVVAEGGGTMIVEDGEERFDAPCLLLMPAGVAHGFRFDPYSGGHVVTVAQSYAAELGAMDGAVRGLFAAPAVVAVDAGEVGRAEAVAEDLMRELGWSLAGHRAAVSAGLLALFVVVLRSSSSTVPRGAGSSRAAALVARLRARIEERFRRREKGDQHAAALGVSMTALRAACAATGGGSPAAMLDQRALLEARRALLYTTMSVGEIGFQLGFDDAAYFSRFFARHVGQAPRDYRRSVGAARSAGRASAAD